MNKQAKQLREDPIGGADLWLADLAPADMPIQEGRGQWSPEEKLCEGILRDACQQLAAEPKTRAARVRKREAEIWFAGGGTVTFEFVCEVLGFDPDWLRKQLTIRPIKRRELYGRTGSRKIRPIEKRA